GSGAAPAGSVSAARADAVSAAGGAWPRRGSVTETAVAAPRTSAEVGPAIQYIAPNAPPRAATIPASIRPRSPRLGRTMGLSGSSSAGGGGLGTWEGELMPETASKGPL